MTSSRFGLRHVAVAAILVSLALPAAADHVDDYSISTSFGYVSEYHFRGVELADGSFQSSLDFTYGHFNFGTWANHPTVEASNSDWGFANEIDFYGGVNFDVSDFSVSAGLTRYWYPETDELSNDADDTLEGYLSVGYATLFDPTLSLYYDFDLETFTTEISGGYAIPLTDNLGLSFGLTLGYVSDQGSRDIFDEDDVLRQENYFYGIANVGVDYALSDNTTANFGVTYSYSTNEWATGSMPVMVAPGLDTYVATGYEDNQNNVFFGASVSASFGGSGFGEPADVAPPPDGEDMDNGVRYISPTIAGFTVSTDWAYESEYVFRGVQLDQASFQPSVSASYEFSDTFTLSGGVWTAQGLDNYIESSSGFEHTTEVDYTLAASIALSDALELNIGGTYYHYPENNDPDVDDNTYELGVGLALPNLYGSPTITTFYDFTLETATVELGAAKSCNPFAGCEQFFVEFNAVLGGVYNFDDDYAFGQAPDEKQAEYFYSAIGTNVGYAFTDYASVSGGLRASINTIDTPDTKNTNFWYGVSANFSY